jgi:hypothetical protein
MAWRDARLSHVKNGVYGEMLIAAMIAAAFVESDWESIVREGLARIPRRCRLAERVGELLVARRRGAKFDEALGMLWADTPLVLPDGHIDAHNYGHAITGAQAIVLALLWGRDDFSVTVGNAVASGYDTDCTAATAGSLWGIRHGAGAIPRLWSEPLEDTLRTSVRGHFEVSISALAMQMATVAHR